MNYKMLEEIVYCYKIFENYEKFKSSNKFCYKGNWLLCRIPGKGVTLPTALPVLI